MAGRKPRPLSELRTWARKCRLFRSSRANITQADAAKLVGVSYHTWHSWEVDRAIPSRFVKEALKAKFPQDF